MAERTITRKMDDSGNSVGWINADGSPVTPLQKGAPGYDKAILGEGPEREALRNQVTQSNTQGGQTLWSDIAPLYSYATSPGGAQIVPQTPNDPNLETYGGGKFTGQYDPATGMVTTQPGSSNGAFTPTRNNDAGFSGFLSTVQGFLNDSALSTPAGKLAFALAGGFGSGMLGGAGDGMAFGGESAMQGSSYANPDWVTNAINDGSMPAVSGGDFTGASQIPAQLPALDSSGNLLNPTPSVPAQMPALDSSGNLLNQIPSTPAQLPALDSSGNVIPQQETLTSPSITPSSPAQSFSNLLHDPDVSAPLNPYAPQSAAQVQTLDMARLDPPVAPEGTFFGSQYGPQGDWEAYGGGDVADPYNMNKDVTNTGTPLDEWNNPIDNRGAKPASVQDVARQTVGSMTPPTSGSDISKFFKDNKDMLRLGASGVSLAASALKKPDTSQIHNLESLAGNINTASAAPAAAASSLIPSVSTGVLPPGADALVNNALHDAQGSIRSKYASMGLSGSTMEAQELSSAAQSAASQRFQMANALTNTGLTAAGISTYQMGSSAHIYEAIMKEQLAQDQQLQKALSDFAAASALGAGASAISNLL